MQYSCNYVPLDAFFAFKCWSEWKPWMQRKETYTEEIFVQKSTNRQTNWHTNCADAPVSYFFANTMQKLCRSFDKVELLTNHVYVWLGTRISSEIIIRSAYTVFRFVRKFLFLFWILFFHTKYIVIVIIYVTMFG